MKRFLSVCVFSIFIAGTTWANFDQDPDFDTVVAVDPTEMDQMGGDSMDGFKSGMAEGMADQVADQVERTDRVKEPFAPANVRNDRKNQMKTCISQHVKRYKAARCSGSSSQEEFRACAKGVKAAAKTEARMVCEGAGGSEPSPFQSVSADM